MKKTFLFIVLIGIMLGIGIWIFKTNNDSLNYQAQRSSTNKNNLDEIDIKSTQSTTDTQQFPPPRPCFFSPSTYTSAS